MMTDIIIYLFLGSMTIAMLSCFIQLFQVKVWLHSKLKREPKLVKIGAMRWFNDQKVPEVHLIGRSKSPAVGRIKMGEDDDNAYVEKLTTDIDDDSIKPQYRNCGYITQDGIIYKVNKSKNAEIVGYTARPSDPNKPIAVGERTWKSLWLKCTLNAYMGKPSDKKKSKEPAAVCYHVSFHSSKNDAMPPETRAAAFALLFGMCNKTDYHEYYNSPAYGWKDTALLSAFIYAIIYVVWYMISVKLLGYRFVGFRFWRVIPIYGMFYALWAIVRAIKIACIENSNTIQPKIDLFNKALGQRPFDIALLLCCTIVLAFTGTYYRYDFVALAMAIATGISTNMLLPSSSKRWDIKNPFAADDEEVENGEVSNPEGDIARNYQWELDSDSSKNIVGELNLYFSSQYINDLRFNNPFYIQRKDKSIRLMILDMYHYMKEHRGITERLRFIVSQIKYQATQQALTTEDRLQFTLDFVQEPNIRFCMNRDSKAINQYEEYIRYPDEVLYDKEADSNSKALLAAMLFHFMGHNVIYLFSRIQHHGAIGIEVEKEWIVEGRIFGKKLEDITILHKGNGKRYIFCETTSDGFRMGGTMEGMRFEDFDDQIELLLDEKDVDDSGEDSLTCLYNWDLDTTFGITMHGTYTLEFNQSEIDELRRENPFKTFSQPDNQKTYEENVRFIFSYLSEEEERMAKVKEIATYIKKSIDDAKLGEYELVQFALDFCQAPNITYCVDEESNSINREKEYMRFPDEVLFDKEGDCDCKSSLTAALFHELGFNVIIMLSQKLQHAAIGIEYKEEWLPNIKVEDKETVIREYNGRKYLYCETTGDGYRVGQIKENGSIRDYETIVEINA